MTTEIQITTGEISLFGNLTIPQDARGLVVFAHGSGSSRFSPRNQRVAGILNGSGLGTLLTDLLTKQEEEIDELTRELRFDIPLLSERLMRVTDWLQKNESTAPFSLGYFGSSTGAAAALIAAARLPGAVRAVVSRGGRVDLASGDLPGVTVPTLFVVGALDEEVLRLNREALDYLGSDIKDLTVIEGATHLFEEQGKLDEVAEAAKDWFLQYL